MTKRWLLWHVTSMPHVWWTQIRTKRRWKKIFRQNVVNVVNRLSIVYYWDGHTYFMCVLKSKFIFCFIFSFTRSATVSILSIYCLSRCACIRQQNIYFAVARRTESKLILWSRPNASIYSLLIDCVHIREIRLNWSEIDGIPLEILAKKCIRLHCTAHSTPNGRRNYFII